MEVHAVYTLPDASTAAPDADPHAGLTLAKVDTVASTATLRTLDASTYKLPVASAARPAGDAKPAFEPTPS